MEGPGHYVGVTQSILQNQGDWWVGDDEMMFIDDPTAPHIIGTGSEDYYLGAWCYGNCGISPFGTTKPTFAFRRYGNPLKWRRQSRRGMVRVPLSHRLASSLPEILQNDDRTRPRESPLRQLLHCCLLVSKGLPHSPQAPAPGTGPHTENDQYRRTNRGERIEALLIDNA